MSAYLARLKQLDDGKNYHYAPDTLPPKPPEPPFAGFDGTGTGHVEKIILDDANDTATLAADYQELTTFIIELCQLVGFSVEAQERMLAARRKLYPFQYSTECAYFRLQVIRARAGAYWNNDALSARAE